MDTDRKTICAARSCVLGFVQSPLPACRSSPPAKQLTLWRRYSEVVPLVNIAVKGIQEDIHFIRISSFAVLARAKATRARVPSRRPA